jgi:hypothetical protein
MMEMTAMTKDEIIRMAVKCQLINAGNREGIYMDALAEFAALVAEAEREACAEVCEDQMQWGEINKTIAIAAGNCADAIRARGDK